MEKIYLYFSLFICLISNGTLYSQEEVSETEEAPAIHFKLLRADEHYDYLSTKTNKSFWEKLKYISIGSNSYFNIGGEVKSQFQLLRNEGWNAEGDDFILFQRFMFHSDFRFGEHIRLFGQLKSAHSIWRDEPESFLTDDDLDVHQLFASINIGQEMKLEFGRQELLYGTRRLISVREGANVRQSFDGGRLIWQQPDKRLDVLFYAYNPQEVGFFDNEINTDRLLWGTYFVKDFTKWKGNHLDLYYLGVRHKTALFEQGFAREVRHSVGFRHWGRTGKLQYNTEGVFQFGEFGENDITAWTISSSINYQIAERFEPTFGLKFEIISGDKDSADDKLQTFNPLYPRGGYFGLLSLVGPANLMDIHPSFTMAITEKIELILDWDFFWRHRTEDGIYFPSGRLNLASNGSNSRFIGHQPGIEIDLAISPFFEVDLNYFIFLTGGFLEDVTEGEAFSQVECNFAFKF